MSKGECQPRNQFLKRALGRCKTRDIIEIIDDEDKDIEDKDDDDDLKIIDDEASHHRTRRNSPPSEVINIDDDDDDSSFQHSDSPLSEDSKSGTSPTCNIGLSRNCLGLGSSFESCSSESDSSSESLSSDDNSSDCEIIGDVSGNIREQWERAASKRKMSHRAQVYPEQEADMPGSSFDAENFINNVFPDPFKGIPCQSSLNNSHTKCNTNFSTIPSMPYFDSPSPIWEFDTNIANNDINTTSDFVSRGPTTETFSDELNPNNVCEDTSVPIVLEPEIVSEDPDAETTLKNPYLESFHKNPGNSIGKDSNASKATTSYANITSFSSTEFNGKTLSEGPTAPVMDEGIHNYHTAPENRMQVEDGSVINREKYKETDEYRHAAEEEWVASQRELHIQAEEAQRLKRKKKAETLRLIDMERRQRQRLEEVRELQKKDEETINLKEHIRAGVRRELEFLEMRHMDMASVLRALGIPVKGGLIPTSREVNAAYKQALLKFHPDRASRSDIRQQVKSEETFKLISRLKEKFML